MCGIVGGFTSARELPNKLNIWWNRIMHRGTHSYGCIIFADKKFYTVKSIAKEHTINYLKGLVKQIGNKEVFFIAHNRYATLGTISKETTHPVKYKDWIVIQNGTKKTIAQMFSVSQDTKGIAILLSIVDKTQLSSNAYKLAVNGTGVFFAYNKSTHDFVFHKDSTRTLFYAPGLTLFASEPVETGAIWYPIADSNKHMKLRTLKDIELDKLLNINKDRKPIKLEKIVKDYCKACGRIRIMSPDGIRCCNCYSKDEPVKKRNVTINRKVHDYYNYLKYRNNRYSF